MNWHEFIFSTKPAHQVRRHVIFWLLWWLYFAATYDYYLQVGLQKIVWEKPSLVIFVQSLLLISVHLVVCYFFIYVLLPKYLVTRKYLMLAGGIVLSAAFLLGAGYFMHSFVFLTFDPAYLFRISINNTLWWTNINSGLLSAPKVIAAAAAIKLIKRWYLKQKEKEKIEKEKLITDLQLMKAQIRPDFLFSSLDQIYKASLANSLKAPGLLVKLADLLSYLLYECEEPKVPLEKEITMMKEYMLLEKSRYGERLELETMMKGELKNKYIAPLLLLPFIENSFKQCNNDNVQPWINLEISVENEILSLKLLNGVELNASNNHCPELKNIEKRLELLYPGKHELKIYIEEEIHVVVLKIDLGNMPGNESMQSRSISGPELKKDYAAN